MNMTIFKTFGAVAALTLFAQTAVAQNAPQDTPPMDHSKMETVDHSQMKGMDHSQMKTMDHSQMEGMDHSQMEGMDHSDMDMMEGMDHSKMDHSGHDHAARPTDSSLAAVSEDAQTIVAKVNGLVCDFCAQALKKVFKKEDAVETISVDLDAGEVRVFLKDGQSLSDKRVAKLIRKSGYSLVGITHENGA